MQDDGFGLLRIPLPRTPVNKAQIFIGNSFTIVMMVTESVRHKARNTWSKIRREPTDLIVWLWLSRP
jgi:hypothetical protein